MNNKNKNKKRRNENILEKSIQKIKKNLILNNNKKKKVSNNILVINNINNNNSINISERTKISSNFLLKKESKNLKNKLLNNKNRENNLTINDDDYELKRKYIKEYLATDFDDMPFEDAIKRDKRSFCKSFCDKLKNDLSILDLLFNKEPFRPRPIKLILIIIHIDIYLFANGIFFNEDFVSKMFQLKKDEENFINFISRSFNRITYTIIIAIAIKNIIECFFIDEKKMKIIFKKEKKNINMMKNKIYQLLKITLNRFIYFIVVSFIITLFTLYYISCFNNIYPHMKFEWIISSIIIIIIMQIFIIAIAVVDTFIRHLSFFLNSEKIFKISSFLN